MKVVICPDKFKDSLTAFEVCQAMQQGIHAALPGAEVVLHPLADGGDGTAEILTWHNGGTFVNVEVHDPLFRKIHARYGLSKDKQTAYIEMAEASGLKLLKPTERNCMHTSTLGTGELIMHAITHGVSKIILCIGGSATNDAGMGVATALGYRFLDKGGNALKPIGENLSRVASIDVSHFKQITLPEVWVACDVGNPLYGPQGAAYVYAPQKGASENDIQQLDTGLRNWASVVKKAFHTEVDSIPGAGAAGGLGAGALAFLNARLMPGIEMVMELTRFAHTLPGTTLILTGEGKIDAQTLHGKVIMGVSELASQHTIPVAALCGTLDATPELTSQMGLHYAASVLQGPCTLQEAQNNAYEMVKMHTTHIIRLFKSACK
jgi:glycerate 2-kinase